MASFTWNASAGAWATASNWIDPTIAGSIAAIAPSAQDAATIAGPAGGGPDTITGPGSASDLAILGGVNLSGAFAFGTVTVGTTLGDSGVLDVLAGASVAVETATVDSGSLVVSGSGARLADSGSAEIGSAYPSAVPNPGTLVAFDHASIQVENLTLGGSSSVAIDGSSLVEVGNGSHGGSGLLVVDQGATLSGSGAISDLYISNGAAGWLSNWIVDNGVITASDGDLYLSTLNEIFGDGVLRIEANSALSLSANDVLPAIEFAGPGANLAIRDFQNGQETDPTGISGTISGFASGDTIELDFAADSAIWSSTGQGTGVLQVYAHVGSFPQELPVYALKLAGDYSSQTFVTTNEGVALSTVTLACFCAGTHILTEDGRVDVARLRVGDWVVTPRGREVIQWIGRREIDLRRHAHPERVSPVRIKRGAFADDIPCRDLILSPDHAVFVDDVLIPIKYLVNGITVVHEHGVDRPRYVHVELKLHSVLFAEGLTVESLMPGADRSSFDNHDGTTSLYPEFNSFVREAYGYAPLTIRGEIFEHVRNRLAERAKKFHPVAKPRRRSA